MCTFLTNCVFYISSWMIFENKIVHASYEKFIHFPFIIQKWGWPNIILTSCIIAWTASCMTNSWYGWWWWWSVQLFETYHTWNSSQEKLLKGKVNLCYAHVIWRQWENEPSEHETWYKVHNKKKIFRRLELLLYCMCI